MYKNPIEEPVSGQELKDWVWHNIHTKTEYTTMAKGMKYCFNLCDEKQYFISFVDDIPQIQELNADDISCNGKG